MDFNQNKESQEIGNDKRESRRKRRLQNQIIAYSITVLLLVVIVLGIFMGGNYIIKTIKENNIKQEQELKKAKLEQEALLEAEKQKQEEENREEPILVPEEDLLEELIDSYLADMTLEEKIAGLFVITPEALTGVDVVVKAGEGTKSALEEYPVGGLIYFANNIKSEAQLKEMIHNTVSYSKYPLFLAIDEEGGKVSRIANANIGVSTMVFMGEIGANGDASLADEAGKQIGTYLSDYGFNVDFAPVADLLTNSDSPLGDRSFSDDALVASSMVEAFIQGLQSMNVSATAKHFPGLGDTSTDTHNSKATTEKTLEEMRMLEFLPFQAAINAGVDFIMVGHISAPKVVGDETPSSLSSMMITEILRNELGFDKIVVTDALNMKAITDHYSPEEAAVLTIQARS